MKKGTFLGMFFVMFLVLALAVPAVWAQNVSLNPSYAQRDVGGKVRMHIEMTGATELLSMGVTVTFPADKLQVDETKTAKNTDVWAMNGHTEPAIEIDNTNGTVKMIGGRLKPGVSGDVLLGWIVFDCIATDTAPVTVGLANPSPYDNFVREDGTVDDPPGFTGATICIVAANACEGDFNDDGAVNPADKFIFRAALGSIFPELDYNPACDFNADGAVNPADKFIFRADLGRIDCPSCP